MSKRRCQRTVTERAEILPDAFKFGNNLMRINASVIQCDCGSPVLVLNEQGLFTCSNPQCVNFEKVFKPVEVKAVRSQKTYRETVYTAAE